MAMQAGDVRVGDHTRRVQVQIPRCVPDLRKAAARHFGDHEGRGFSMKLHHGGISAVTHDHHVKALQDEDVVVVSWDGGTARGPKLPSSTMHADYVKHPLSQTGPTSAVPHVSEGIPFEATSSYTLEYPPKRPHSVRTRRWEVAKPNEVPFTARTTYGDHFTGRQPRSPPAKSLTRVPAPSPPFQAASMYRQEYVKHPLTSPVLASGIDRPMPDRAFEADTTYKSEFFDRGVPPAPRRRYVSGPPGSRVPFNGRSEYRERYKGEDASRLRNPCIYLEPEEGSAMKLDGL